MSQPQQQTRACSKCSIAASEPLPYTMCQRCIYANGVSTQQGCKDCGAPAGYWHSPLCPAVPGKHGIAAPAVTSSGRHGWLSTAAFKAGDILECIDDANCRNIKVGNVYTVLKEASPRYLTIRNELGVHEDYDRKRFKFATTKTQTAAVSTVSEPACVCPSEMLGGSHENTCGWIIWKEKERR